MMRAHCATLALVPLMLAGLPACTEENTGGDWIATAEAEDAIERADSPERSVPLSGTFRDEYAAGGIAVLTLKTDWTFHLEEAVVCVRYPCELPQANGRYTYGQRSGMSTLILRDESGTMLYEIGYMLRGQTLHVSQDASGSVWQELRLSERAWCAEPPDCSLQSLRTPRCRGAWACETSVCSFQCGRMVSEPVTETSCSPDSCISEPSTSEASQ